MSGERQHTRPYKGLQGVLWGEVDSCVGMGLGWRVRVWGRVEKEGEEG